MMLKTNLKVTDADNSDVPFIALLEKECFSSPWSPSQIFDEIKKNNVIFLVAKTENDFCGYISGQLILDEFYISNIAVSESFRRQRVASSLVQEIINRLSVIECAFATLEVRESNAEARQLYEKFGFVNLGTRKNFYDCPRENACIYTLYFNEESGC